MDYRIENDRNSFASNIRLTNMTKDSYENHDKALLDWTYALNATEEPVIQVFNSVRVHVLLLAGKSPAHLESTVFA